MTSARRGSWAIPRHCARARHPGGTHGRSPVGGLVGGHIAGSIELGILLCITLMGEITPAIARRRIEAFFLFRGRRRHFLETRGKARLYLRLGRVAGEIGHFRRRGRRRWRRFFAWRRGSNRRYRHRRDWPRLPDMAAFAAADFAALRRDDCRDLVAGPARGADDNRRHDRNRLGQTNPGLAGVPPRPCPNPLIPDSEFSIKSEVAQKMLSGARSMGDSL